MKEKITNKIQILKQRLNQLNTEIVTLDTQLGVKRRNFIKIEGMIEGFQAVLNEIDVELKVDEEDENK